MKKRKFWFLFWILIVLACLTGCKNEKENIELEKGLSEVRFLENQCISIIGKYLSGDYDLENGDVNWDLISEDYVVLNNSISVILVDFASLQIPSKIIVDLEENFNSLNMTLQSKDINEFMKKICDNYSLVSKSVLGNISKDKIVNLEKNTKSQLLYTGYYLKQMDKENSFHSLENFETNYDKLSKEKEYLENNSYQINKIFIDIQKIKNFIEKQDFENGKNVLLQILQQL